MGSAVRGRGIDLDLDPRGIEIVVGKSAENPVDLGDFPGIEVP